MRDYRQLTTDHRSEIRGHRTEIAIRCELGAWHKRLYNSNGPEVGGSAFAAAIYGATKRIILLLEWSKNLLINQDPSGKRRGW
jgi:hypothetical protein